MNFEEFVNEVKSIFARSGYTKKQVEKYFATNDVKEALEQNYEMYSDDNEHLRASATPAATANMLDWMF